MGNFLEVLSGGVPGGILVLFLLLFIINLAFSFFRSSKLISQKQTRKNQLVYSAALILIYYMLWFAFQPDKPRVRVVVLPTVSVDGTLLPQAKSFEFAEMFQHSAKNSLQNKYLLHRWEWLWDTIGPDSVDFPLVWRQKAFRLNAGTIIKTELASDGISCNIYSGTDSIQLSAGTPELLIKKVIAETDLFSDQPISVLSINENYLALKLALLKKEYDTVLDFQALDHDPNLMILQAEVLARKGLAKKIDHEKEKYISNVNQDLDRANNMLVNMVKNKTDLPETAYWMGRIAIYRQEYGKAEVYLKKALADDPENSRIHLALSYLLPERLVELGYDNRLDILKKAVELDPGFREGVYQLAEEYYNAGTGTAEGTGTTKAKQTIGAFLKINKSDLKILGLLANIQLKLEYFDDALSLYNLIAEKNSDYSSSWHNLGIVYFMKKEYSTALPYFLKAINMDENLDSYLYAGVTYRTIGDNQNALKYYRERVRRMTGHDDKWAKEAMKGIRKILADTTRSSEQ